MSPDQGPDVLGTLTTARHHPIRLFLVAGLVPLVLLAACGSNSASTSTGDGETPAEAEADRGELVISAIPDQEPAQLQRLYDTVADYLGERLDVDVTYVPVTDYPASVSLFRTGDLDLVWFGGLTGTQARLQTAGSRAIVQRDIDEEFHSIFLASTAAGIEPFGDVDGLARLAGRRFTFGSESSTSGRLMPQYFLDRAGVGIDDFEDPAGFSGSHDATIDLVESGSFEAGVVNEQVWLDRLAAGEVDESKVVAIFRSPPYHDYHWLIGPSAIERFGERFVDEVTDALVQLDASDPRQAEILELFGAERFIPTEDDNYAEIEQIGREAGLIN